VFFLQSRLGGQCLLPAPLEAPHHQAVLRLDCVVLPLGALDLVVRLLKA
jgi:hypothetical protein